MKYNEVLDMDRKRQIFEELVLQGGECVFAIS